MDANTAKLFDASMRVTGANLKARAAALVNFVQGADSGRFKGDEFRALLEANPYLMRLVAERQGKTIGELRRQAVNAGGLPAEDVTRVMHSSARMISENSEALPLSYEERQAMEDADNHVEGESVSHLRVIQNLCGVRQ